ncbi:unnamed protein product [Calypogeia fissa]
MLVASGLPNSGESPSYESCVQLAQWSGPTVGAAGNPNPKLSPHENDGVAIPFVKTEIAFSSSGAPSVHLQSGRWLSWVFRQL